MTPIRLLRTSILPALDELATLGIPANLQAARLMLAIPLQESGLTYRRQISNGGIENGPANSYWQFEVGGGCKGILTHHAVSARTIKICEAYNIKPEPLALWEAMRYQDIVAACAARLLIYTLPGMLPDTQEEGWKQYIAAWRPGKPHPQKWAECWRIASETVGVK